MLAVRTWDLIFLGVNSFCSIGVKSLTFRGGGGSEVSGADYRRRVNKGGASNKPFVPGI